MAAANCFLILAFFATALKNFSWQVWFLSFAISCVLDEASGILCAWKENWNWEGETNWLLRRLEKEFGSKYAACIHALMVINAALLITGIINMVFPVPARLILFLGSVYMFEACVHNITLSLFNYETWPVFAP